HKLQKITGPTGVPRFVAESDSSGHADQTWACFLAVNASDGPSGPVTVNSRRRRSSVRLLEGY
ncbi:terminase, partial [Escherichia coli]|nr:terminase [Escherichia coli]